MIACLTAALYVVAIAVGTLVLLTAAAVIATPRHDDPYASAVRRRRLR